MFVDKAYAKRRIRESYIMQGLSALAIVICGFAGAAAISYHENFYLIILGLINFSIVVWNGFIFNKWYGIRDGWKSLRERLPE